MNILKVILGIFLIAILPIVNLFANWHIGGLAIIGLWFFLTFLGIILIISSIAGVQHK